MFEPSVGTGAERIQNIRVHWPDWREEPDDAVVENVDAVAVVVVVIAVVAVAADGSSGKTKKHNLKIKL